MLRLHPGRLQSTSLTDGKYTHRPSRLSLPNEPCALLDAFPAADDTRVVC